MLWDDMYHVSSLDDSCIVIFMFDYVQQQLIEYDQQHGIKSQR